MANKKIRDYVPGKNDYLQFAEIMNKNAQIDFQSNNREGGGQPTVQNPIVTNTNINSGVSTPNTQPLPIGAQAYSQIRGGFKGVLDDSIKGVDSKYTSVYGRALGDSFSQSLYDGGASGGKTESGETGNATGGVGNSAGSGSGAGAVTAPAASGKLSYDNWMKDYGYDPETDYNQAKNDLEYQYMTYLNNYGARAEELYQMGLSGSGISDLYGVNAYSAYLAASNDLALARIEQENEYRRMYKAYSDEFDSAEQSKTETEKGEAGTIAANLVSQLNYSPEKAQSFRDYYKTQGKSDEWIDSVIESADALYNLNQSTVNVSDIKSHVDSMLAEAEITYDGSESAKNAIKTYLDQNNLSQHYDALIKEYDAGLKTSQDAAIDDVVKDLNAAADVVPESIVLQSLETGVQNYKIMLSRGEITQDQYDTYVEASSNAVKAGVLYALENEKTLANAYTLVGATAEEWNSLTDDDGKVLTGNGLLSAQKEAVMDALCAQHAAGSINDEDFSEVMNEWIVNEVNIAKDTGKNGVADIVLAAGQLAEWREYYSEDLFDSYMNNLMSESGMSVNYGGSKQIFMQWNDGGDNYEITLTCDGGKRVDKKLEKTLEGLRGDRFLPLICYEGKLYNRVTTKDGVSYWAEATSENLKWYDDKPKYITDNVNDALYNLLVYALRDNPRAPEQQ